jgi:hypothetical protein
MSYPTEGSRQANPVRLSLACELGCDIDGAWWPRTERIQYELPQLVAVLKPMLGAAVIVAIARGRITLTDLLAVVERRLSRQRRQTQP